MHWTIVFKIKTNHMKIILVILISFFSFSKAFATAQYPDRIIFNNKEYSLFTNPLERYFVKNEDKRPKGGVISTALWRGYVATFEIIENQFYVKDIEIEIRNKTSDGTEWKSVIDEVFPKTEDRKIDWFNGLLILPYGELINYVHMGYESTYENYIIIEIDKGKYLKSKDLNYKEYENLKERQFEAFYNSNEHSGRKED